MSITQLRTTASTALPDDVLARCRERAAGYDRDNVFFADDFEELRALGYLTAAVPAERGGWGLDLAALAAEQRRLARHAPATALALCMHHYWVGIAADLTRAGIAGHAWVLDDVTAGEVFAAGHAEAGNDIPVLLSSTAAERVDGGWRVTGRKHFGSLSPAWTRLGVHAMDTSDPDAPKVVHGFAERGEGVQTVETWDTLGMRATQSHDTVLDGAFIPDARVASVHPAGTPDPYVGVMLVWALTLISNVYVGIAERALDLAVESATTKSSIAIPRSTYAHNPMVQHQVSSMFLELEAARASIDRIASDWVSGVDHGDMWAPKVWSAKWRAVESAKRIVDTAMDVAGGSAFFRRSELERLYRDVRAGGFHPATDAFAHEMIGKIVLGVDPSGPRW